MGQKRTWSFHHVPFTMLWENMSINYNNNWQSSLNSIFLNGYSESIFDKQHLSNNFTYAWKRTNICLPVKVKNTFVCGKTPLIPAKKPKYGIRFVWVENANSGTNETSCTRSYITQQNDSTTILNFFFRETLNVANLKKKRKPADFFAMQHTAKKGGFDKKLNEIFKEKYPWTLKRRFRKSDNKKKTFSKKMQNTYYRVFNLSSCYYVKYLTRPKKLSDKARQRFFKLQRLSKKQSLSAQNHHLTQPVTLGTQSVGIYKFV